MTNPPPLLEAIDNLVKIVEKTTSSPKDKTDAYLAIGQHFQSDFQAAERHLENHASRLIELTKMHINSSHLRNQADLALAALQVLGLCLSSNRLAKIPKESLLSGILSDVCNILQAPKDKKYYVRSFWLLANQHIHSHILSKHVAAIMSCFLRHTSDANCRRTVVAQAMPTIKRLCCTCPNEMEGEIDKCLDVIFAELVLSPESFRYTVDVLKACIPVLLKRRAVWKDYITKKLNEGLGTKVGQFFKQACKLEAICFWTSMVKLLGADIYLLEKDTKNCWTWVMQNSFNSCHDDVVSAVYDMWIAIVDAFIPGPGEGLASTRQVKLIMEPLKIRFHRHKTRTAAEKCLRTYWYLICKIGGKLNEYMHKVVLPVLQGLFSTPENPSTTRQTTPIKPAPISDEAPDSLVKNSNLALKSPSQSPALKVLAVEMFCVLISTSEERSVIERKLGGKLDPFVGPKISSEHIMRNITFFSEFLLEATRSCLLINEALVIQSWISFVMEVKASPHAEGDPEIWCSVFSVLGTVVNEELGSVNFILRVAGVVPYGIALSSLKSDENPNGHAALFIIQSILHPHYIKLEAYENEKFFVMYESMIKVLFNGVSGQLPSADNIFSCLVKANSFLDGRTSWRLWSTLTHWVNRYVSISNEVNQGTAADHDFSIALKSLVYPMEFIDLSKLKEGEKDNLVDTWSESYETFNRAISLLPGIKNNRLLDEFCRSMMKHSETDTCKFIDIIVRVLWVVIKSAVFDFASGRSFSICGFPVGEFDELGVFRHFLSCITLVVKPMLESREQASRNTDKYLFEFIEMLQYFFDKLDRYPQLYCTMKLLSQILPLLLEKCSPSQSKLFSYVEKLTDSIYLAFKNASNVEYDVELMHLFEPLIINATSSKRRQTRVRAVQFWNETFGRNESLTCSTTLKDVLIHSKTPIKPLIDGVTRSERAVNDFDETTQFPDASQSQSQSLEQSGGTSPVKVMGSFLPKHQHDNFKITPMKSTLMPSETKSPASTSSSSSAKSRKPGRRKLPIDLTKDDFVEIKDGPKKSHLLTEHQKEIRREKKLIPVMYNNLDQQSQDTSLFTSLLHDSNSQPTQVMVSENVVVGESAPENSDNVDFERNLSPINTESNGNELPLTDREPDVLTAEKNNATSSIQQELGNDIMTETVKSVSLHVQDAQTAATPIQNITVETSPFEDDDDCIPSSQTQQSFSQVRSPYVDPKQLLRAKIVESPGEQLVHISTLQVVVDNIKAEDFVEGNKENEFSNPPSIPAEIISTADSAQTERTNIRTKSTIGWLSTEASPSKPPLISLSLPKENRNDNVAKLGGQKKMAIKRKRKSQISRSTQRKKSRPLPSEDEIHETTDHLFQQDAFAVRETVVTQPESLTLVENEKETHHVNTRSIPKCNEGIEAEESSHFAGCKDTSTEEKLVNILDESECASDEGIGSDVNKEQGVQIQPSTSNSDDDKRLHPCGTGTTMKIPKGIASVNQPSESHVPESLKCPLAAEIKEFDKSSIDDEALPDEVIERTVESVSKSDIESKITCTGTVTISQQIIATTSYSSVSHSSACGSPVAKAHTAASYAKSTIHGSPQGMTCILSPHASPASILKKRSFCQSPSPPSKNRRVSFQLPEGTMPLNDDGSQSAQDKDKDKFTNVCSKMGRQKLKKSDAPSIYPDLTQCTTPIEKILPSITLSRGVGHLVRAQNILTIGDLSSLSESQVENLPIRSPKLRTVKNALNTYSTQLARQKLTLKSPLSITEFSSPQKDGRGGEALAVLVTPSKQGDFIKPTSLFNVSGTSDKEDHKSPLPAQPKGEPESPLLRTKLEQKLEQNHLSDGKERGYGSVEVPISVVAMGEKRQILIKSELLKEESSEQKLDTCIKECEASVAPLITAHEDVNGLETRLVGDSSDSLTSVIEEEEDVLYSTPTDGSERETILKIDPIDKDVKDSNSTNLGSKVEPMHYSNEKTALEKSVLCDLSGLKEGDQVGQKTVKTQEDVPSMENDSFESAFAAGNISPIKNNNESSFFETSSIDVSDKDEEGKAKDVSYAFLNRENQATEFSVDQTTIEGITPITNQSDLSHTSLNEVGDLELSTSVICVPSSIISMSTTEELTLKASLTSDGVASVAQDVIPEVCSSTDRKTVASAPSPSSLYTQRTITPKRTNMQSTHNGILPHIDISNLPTHDIFELVSELENLKSGVMAELKSRMLGHHGKKQ